MRQDEILVGEVYYRAMLTRGTPTPTDVQVKVFRKGLTRGYGGRRDGVEVARMVEQEDGTLKYHHVDPLTNEPQKFILTARELLTVEHVARLREEEERRMQERIRRQELRQAYEYERSLAIAMRLGISEDKVSVSGQFLTSDADDLQTRYCSITPEAVEQIMTTDPDADLISDALSELNIEQGGITARNAAEHIVESLRKNGNGEHDEEDEGGEDA